MTNFKPLRQFLAPGHEDDDIVIVCGWEDGDGIDLDSVESVTLGSLLAVPGLGWMSIPPVDKGDIVLEKGFTPYFPASEGVPEENIEPGNFVWLYCRERKLVAAVIKLERSASPRLFCSVSVDIVM